MARIPRAVLTDEGLLLPVRPPRASTLAGFVLGTLLLVAGGAFLLVRLVQVRDWRALVGAAVLLAVSALFAAATVSIARQDRTGSTGLLLTPEAVRLTDRDQPVTVPWEAIAAVEETSPLVEESGEKHPHWVSFRLHAGPGPGSSDELRLLSGSPYPSIDGEALVAGHETALAVCGFYLASPQERAELTTPAAVARV